MKDSDSIVIDKFTLHYKKDENKYKVLFTDFTFHRGNYEHWVGNPANDNSLHFKSSQFPAYQTDHNNKWTWFLPGAQTGKDNTVIRVSLEIIKNLVDCLNNPPKDATLLDDKVDTLCKEKLDSNPKGYFVVSGTKPTWATCKESLTSYLGENNGYKPLCYICEKFTEENIKWLREIQEKIELQNRFLVTKLQNCIKIDVPKWWRIQPYYRIGWMLLAIRVANGRYVLNDNEKPLFETFKDGKFSIDLFNYREWSGQKNWIHWLKTDATKLL